MYLFAPRESMRRLYLVVKDYAMVSPYAGTRCKNMNFPINNVVTFSLVGQIQYTARYTYSVIFIMRPRVRACKLGIFRSFSLVFVLIP